LQCCSVSMFQISLCVLRDLCGESTLRTRPCVRLGVHRLAAAFAGEACFADALPQQAAATARRSLSTSLRTGKVLHSTVSRVARALDANPSFPKCVSLGLPCVLGRHSLAGIVGCICFIPSAQRGRGEDFSACRIVPFALARTKFQELFSPAGGAFLGGTRPQKQHQNYTQNLIHSQYRFSPHARPYRQHFQSIKRRCEPNWITN
jgi:hypothetical protein